MFCLRAHDMYGKKFPGRVSPANPWKTTCFNCNNDAGDDNNSDFFLDTLYEQLEKRAAGYEKKEAHEK